MTDMTPEQALEACPFCGGTPSFAFRYHSMFDVKVVCVCDVEGPLFDANDGRPDELARNRLAAAEHWNARAALSRPAVPADHDERVSRMVDAFLGWKLPHDFAPDCGIEFAPLDDGQSWPIGTNLFTAVQARQMIEHLLAASSTPVLDGWQPIETAPKGVTDVLDLWACGERYTDCIWMKPTYDTEYRWCHEGDRDCDGPVAVPVPNPTHWRRPPAPPAGEKDRYAPTSPTPAPAVPEVTDDMALAFHRAIGDGSLGQSDVDDIKAGLRRVFESFGAPAPAVPEGLAERVRGFLERAKVPGKDYLYCLKPSEIESMLAAAPAEESSGDGDTVTMPRAVYDMLAKKAGIEDAPGDHFRDATKMIDRPESAEGDSE